MYGLIACSNQTIHHNRLIRASEDGFAGGGLAGIEALPFHAAFGLIKRNDAHGCLGLLFDRLLRRAVFRPFDAHKATIFRDNTLELFVAVCVVHVLFTELDGPLEESMLYVV